METKYHIIRNKAELKKLIKACKTTGVASVDFETNGRPIYTNDFIPTILSVSFQVGSGIAIPLAHPESPFREGGVWKKYLLYFGRKVIEDKSIVKVGWNWKFDNQIFELFGIYSRGTVIDGMLAKYLLNEERPNGLKDMVRRYLPEHGDYEKADKFDSMPWDKKPLEPLSKYGCQDTDYTLRLTVYFESRLIDVGLYPLFRHLIMPASRVLQHAEKVGLFLDRAFNEKLLESYQPKIEQAEKNCLTLPRVIKFSRKLKEERIEEYINKIQDEIDQLDPDDPANKRKIKTREDKISNIRAGIFRTNKEKDLVKDVNLGSPKDLPRLLYSEEGFNMPVLKYTKDKNNRDTDSPSTDEETLVNLRLRYKDPKCSRAIFLDNLLELRGLKKMFTTYIEGWHEKVQDDSKLHGQFNIIGTTSGRLCIASDSSILTNLGLLKIGDLIPPEEGILDTSHDDIYAYTHKGRWQLIIRTLNKGYEEMFEVTLENGKSIKCTADHRFLTNNGWKKLKDIDYEKDEVICYDPD